MYVCLKIKLSSLDDYNVSEIRWLTKGKQPADVDDDWAWTFAYELNGVVIPAVGALVDDLNEKDYIDVDPYRITMEKNKFLYRRLIDDR